MKLLLVAVLAIAVVNADHQDFYDEPGETSQLIPETSEIQGGVGVDGLTIFGPATPLGDNQTSFGRSDTVLKDQLIKVDDMEMLVGRSKWCKRRGGRCTNPKKSSCGNGHQESPKGRPYCTSKRRRCCYPREKQTLISCESHNLNIECGLGQLINVIQASYGRSSLKICTNGPGITQSSLGCHSNTSTQVVNDRCNGNRKCIVPAINRIFGDPCGGVYKYLQVDFICVQPGGQSLIACEGHSLNIVCNAGKVIKVIHASYGRSSLNVCTNGPGITQSSLGCHSSTSKQVVSARCNGNRSCTVPASKGIFGDPCGGHYKYLQVYFECV